MKMTWMLSILAAMLLSVSAALAGEATLRYSFDEASGATLQDSGPLHQDLTLIVSPDLPVEDVAFVAGPEGEWRPLMRNGAQIKGIQDSKAIHFLSDSEAPIVFDRRVDYEIDCAKGLAKALPGGRMHEKDQSTAGLTYVNPGPTRVKGMKGGALSFDGKDDYAEGPAPVGAEGLTALTIDFWFQLPQNWNKSATLISLGDNVSVGFENGALVFRHADLKGPKGETATRLAAEVSTGSWHHLRASYAKNAATLSLDDQPVGSADQLKGTITISGPIRLGGTVDPHFYAGLMDDLTITMSGPGLGN